MRFNSFIFAFLTVAVMAGCSKKTNTTTKQETAKAWDPATLDSTVKPGDDFFAWVNNKWIASHPMPGDKSRFGAFDILDDNSLNTLHSVMENASKANAAKGTNSQKVGDFYFSGMDSAGIEKAGITPLKTYLDQIDAIQNGDDMMKMIASMHLGFAFAGFSASVQQDLANSEIQELSVNQGGLGLPDRDYYFRNDDKSKELRTQYVQHITNVLTLMGEDGTTAAKNANTIMTIETELAKSSMTNVEQRDPHATYHLMDKNALMQSTPNINWNVYFTEIKAPAFTSLNVSQPDFFKKLNGMMKTVSMSDWKEYLKFHLVNNYASYLSSDFVNEDFDFYSRKLEGTKEMKPRWKRICETGDFCLGEALGQEYVKVAFSPESKQRMIELINNLKAAYSERFNQLTWMNDSTKAYAQKKLATLNVKVGYPDKWRDYSALDIDRGPYVLNVMRAFSFETHRKLNKIGQPVDRTEWGMTPQTVNAYYDPSMNEIVFPAGILQPPFFDPNADDALNYGGVGVVIGHEISHGFDDQGRQFDAKGNMTDWWTPEDAKKYDEHTAMIVSQFNTYFPLDSVHINGDLTLGENIADFGGITIAYQAFMKTQEAKDNKTVDGYTAQQRFFIGFARIWAGMYTPEAMRRQLLTNPHSPGKWRVNGTVTNVPEWYAAFNIQPGDKMYRPENERAIIW